MLYIFYVRITYISPSALTSIGNMAHYFRRSAVSEDSVTMDVTRDRRFNGDGTGV